ncbi:hypothetical protein CEXT_759631 [Caerostris extrusa]|uniref:Uncharacterized protein n=1 Tax=Caerostris extrusa TaxID=172846 RepID=A0AAV4NW95_CAEEX|nr:hypothetical protein CEXT_759631 [Caerostris extrusa]
MEWNIYILPDLPHPFFRARGWDSQECSGEGGGGAEHSGKISQGVEVGGSFARVENRLSSKSPATTSHRHSIDLTFRQKEFYSVIADHCVGAHRCTFLQDGSSVTINFSSSLAVPKKKEGASPLPVSKMGNDWQGCSCGYRTRNAWLRFVCEEGWIITTVCEMILVDI